MTRVLIIGLALQLVGVVVVLAEILLPSGGILTIAAIAAFGYSLYVVFSQIGVSAGIWFVLADAVLIPVLVVIGIRSLGSTSAALRQTLGRGDGVVSQGPGPGSLVGRRGNVITPCRPAGRAMIDGTKHDVVSSGDYIDEGAVVVVKEVSGNRIVVGEIIEDPNNI